MVVSPSPGETAASGCGDRRADGRSIPVPHPEFVSFNPKGRTAVVMDERDGFEVVDLPRVVWLSFEGQPVPNR